jgi:hypothetical protein
VRPAELALRPRLARAVIAGLALALALLNVTIPAEANRGASAARAHAARAIGIRDEGQLRFISSSGSQLFDEGSASGSMPGKVRVRFIYNGDPEVTAQFTIDSRYGSISGHAQGRLSNPTSTDPSFRGSLAITAGSGRYAHAYGSGELFGVFYRRNYNLSVQAIATLHY